MITASVFKLKEIRPPGLEAIFGPKWADASPIAVTDPGFLPRKVRGTDWVMVDEVELRLVELVTETIVPAYLRRKVEAIQGSIQQLQRQLDGETDLAPEEAGGVSAVLQTSLALLEQIETLQRSTSTDEQAAAQPVGHTAAFQEAFVD